MSEGPFCANFDISFSLFCRKSVQSWMRRFWAKKCRRDHLRSLWRFVVVVTVRRWQRSAAAERKMGMSDKVWDYEACDGLSWLWRSVLQVRREVKRSDPSTQIPRVEVFWNEDPRRSVISSIGGLFCIFRSKSLLSAFDRFPAKQRETYIKISTKRVFEHTKLKEKVLIIPWNHGISMEEVCFNSLNLLRASWTTFWG